MEDAKFLEELRACNEIRKGAYTVVFNQGQRFSPELDRIEKCIKDISETKFSAELCNNDEFLKLVLCSFLRETDELEMISGYTFDYRNEFAKFLANNKLPRNFLTTLSQIRVVDDGYRSSALSNMVTPLLATGHF